MLVRHQAALVDQPLERLGDQVFPRPHVVEDLPLEGEKTAVDPEIGLIHVPDVLDHAVLADVHDVKGLARPNADEAADRVATMEVVQVHG